jgi:ATP-dependent DNA helicase DinG
MFLDNLASDLSGFKLRPQQKEAFEYIKNCFEKTHKKFVLMNLPMGVGKSLLAIESGKYYFEQKERYVDIVTAGKPLQDQYAKTFPSVANLKGKNNYYCEEFQTSCDKGNELCKLNKMECEFCPYKSAKSHYIQNPISLTNFHLYLINRIYNIPDVNLRYSEHSDVLIVDEAHLFDDTISSFFQVKLSEKIISRNGIPDSDMFINMLSNCNDIDSFIDIIKNINGKLMSILSNLESEDLPTRISAYREIEVANGYQKGKMDKNSEEFAGIVADYTNLSNKYNIFLNEYKTNSSNWVIEFNTEDDVRTILVEPVWVGEYLEKYIWSKYKKVILMSATILNKEIFCGINGIDVNDANYFSIPIPFHPDNRKIYYVPLNKMSFNEKANTFNQYKKIIPMIVKKYKGKKGIIHTNSFELSKWISEGIELDRFITHDTNTREDALKYFFESEGDNILVSPSVGTGVSFDDDLARFQIIAKIPYPSLASTKNKKRLEQNKEWYSLTTVQHLVQICGRVVRSMEDYGDTFIIDGSFSDILRYSSKYIPEWLLGNIFVKPAPKSVFA